MHQPGRTERKPDRRLTACALELPCDGGRGGILWGGTIPTAELSSFALPKCEILSTGALEKVKLKGLTSRFFRRMSPCVTPRSWR